MKHTLEKTDSDVYLDVEVYIALGDRFEEKTIMRRVSFDTNTRHLFFGPWEESNDCNDPFMEILDPPRKVADFFATVLHEAVEALKEMAGEKFNHVWEKHLTDYNYGEINND